MTSEERKEARFQRRKAKREAKRERVLEEHGDYYKVISRNALSKSAIEAAKGVSYKASVKRYNECSFFRESTTEIAQSQCTGSSSHKVTDTR